MIKTLKKWFTLIEMLLVVIIIGIILSYVISKVNIGWIKWDKAERQTKAAANNFAMGVRDYQSENPSDWTYVDQTSWHIKPNAIAGLFKASNGIMFNKTSENCEATIKTDDSLTPLKSVCNSVANLKIIWTNSNNVKIIWLNNNEWLQKLTTDHQIYSQGNTQIKSSKTSPWIAVIFMLNKEIKLKAGTMKTAIVAYDTNWDYIEWLSTDDISWY